MLVDALAKFAPWIVGLIFQGGMLYVTIRAMRADLNGVGRKVRGIQEANEQRYLAHVVVSLMVHVSKENRAVYIAQAKMFLDAGKGRNL
jgi:hypothetical protein